MIEQKEMNFEFIDTDAMDSFISSANSRTISKIWQISSWTIYRWMGVPTKESVNKIQSKIPELNEFIDFDGVRSRISDVPFMNDEFAMMSHTRFEIFFPELIFVRDKFCEAFLGVKNGLEKAEAWLYPSAFEAGATADLEALIYFRSKGEIVISSSYIKEIWMYWINEYFSAAEPLC